MSSVECQNSCDPLNGEHIANVEFYYDGKITYAKILLVNNVYTTVTKSYGNMSTYTIETLLQYSKHFSNDFEEVLLLFPNNSRIKIFKDTVDEKYFIVMSKNNEEMVVKEGVSDDFNLQRYIEESLKI